jgi:ABC-type uncharacterized transport system substrate-binding protein
MKTKEDFHKLIDEIKDEVVLKNYFELIRRLNNSQTGELWKKLNLEEQQELLLSFEESFNPDNLISQEQVKKQHGKWLEK